MSVQFRALRKVRKSISKQVKGKACKFRFIVTYEYLDLKCNNKWKPTEVSVVWFRGARSKISCKPTATTFGVEHKTSVSTYTLSWVPATSVELVVTLFKDITGTTFRSKDYMFMIENVSEATRKKLAIFPCNMADYASLDGQVFDLEMEFKPMSKKIASAKLGAKIKCEFLKEGEAYEDDMQSNFSHLSDADYHQRMSELVECSDEEEEETVKIADVNKISRRAKHTWSHFLDEMKTIEYKNVSAMMDNPLAEGNDAEHVDYKVPVTTSPEPSIINIDQQSGGSFKHGLSSQQKNPTVTRLLNGERDARKKVVSAVLEDLTECEEEGELSDVSPRSPYSNHKSTKLEFTFPETKPRSESLPCVARQGNQGSTLSLDSKNQRLKQWLEDMDDSTPSSQNRIEELEKENKHLESTKVDLEKKVLDLSKDKAELNVEINELQLLVEDLKMQLESLETSKEEKEQHEAAPNLEGKPSKPEKQYCQVRGWLCKRGVKGPTGRRWRRRWFSTDTDGRLYYYKKSNNIMPRGFIVLEKILVVQDLPEAQQDGNNASFNVATPARTYELMAHDADEKFRWINALDYLRHSIARPVTQ